MSQWTGTSKARAVLELELRPVNYKLKAFTFAIATVLVDRSDTTRRLLQRQHSYE
jgi:hypothetical protein